MPEAMRNVLIVNLQVFVWYLSLAKQMSEMMMALQPASLRPAELLDMRSLMPRRNA